MDHIQIIKRSWQITWNYRILWVFGFLLALTSTMGGGGAQGPGYNLDQNDIEKFFGGGRVQMPGFTDFIGEISGAFVSLAIMLGCLGLVFAIAAGIAHYVSQTALFRMVDQHEKDGTKTSLMEGFRLGWIRKSLDVFLIDLLVGLIAFIIGSLMALLAALPLLTWLTDSDILHAVGTVSSIALGFLVLLIFITAGIIISLLLHFARRICVFENRSVIDSIQLGINLVRANLGDVIIMGLILFGIGLGFAIAMIPIILILLFLALLLGGVPGYLVYTLADSFMDGAAPYLLGGAIAFPIFFLIMVIPTSIIGGIFEAFKSSVWTLTYRQLRSPINEPAPQPEPEETLPGENLPAEDIEPSAEE